MRDLDIAWAAGFYEGEGNCYANISKTVRPKIGLSLSVLQVNPEPIWKFLRIFPEGKTYIRPAHKNNQEATQLMYFGQAAVDVFNAMKPYLSNKRIQQFELQVQKMDEAKALRDLMPKKTRPKRTHCRKGHELTKSNVYVEPKGARICKTCRRAREKAYYGAR